MASKLTLGELIWQIHADSAQFDKAMTNSQKGMQKFGQGATATGKKLAVGLTVPLVALGAIAIKNASDFETQRVAFGTLLKDVEKGNKLFEDLKKFSAETPLALGDITKSSQRLLASGVALEKQVDTIRQLGDLSLGSADKLDRLTNAYTKLKLKGRASLEELNLFSEAGVDIMGTLATQYGVTSGELFNLVSAGKVGFEDVQTAMDTLTGSTGAFNNAMKNASETTAGKMSTALDNLKIASAEFGNIMLPTINNMLVGITELAQKFAGLDEGTKKNIVTIGLLVASIAPVLLMAGGLASAIVNISKAVNVAKASMTALKLSAMATSSAMLTIAPLAVVAGVVALGLKIQSIVSHANDIKDYTEDIRDLDRERLSLTEKILDKTGKISETEKTTARIRLDALNAERKVLLANQISEIKNQLQLDRQNELTGVGSYAQQILSQKALLLVDEKREKLAKVINELRDRKPKEGSTTFELLKETENEFKYYGERRDEIINSINNITDASAEQVEITRKTTESLLINYDTLSEGEKKIADALFERLRITREIKKEEDTKPTTVITPTGGGGGKDKEPDPPLLERYAQAIRQVTTENKLLGNSENDLQDKISTTENFISKLVDEGLNPWGVESIYLQNILKNLRKEIDKNSESTLTFSEKMGNVTEIIGAVGGLASSFAQIFENANQRELDALDLKIDKLNEVADTVEETKTREIEALEGALDIAILEARTTEAEKIRVALEDAKREKKKLELEKQLEKERDALEKKGARRAYALNMVSWSAGLSIIGINTAKAVSGALGNYPYPPYSIPQAVTAGLLGGAELANAFANKPQPPQFAEGVYSIPSDTSAFVHAGESIIPKNFTESINAGEIAIANPNKINGEGQTIQVILDGELIYNKMHKASQQGRLLIDAGAVVS